MPSPKGKENVTAYVDESIARQVDELADESGLSRSRYVSALVFEAVRNRRRFRLKKGEFIEEKPDTIPASHGTN